MGIFDGDLWGWEMAGQFGGGKLMTAEEIGELRVVVN